MYLITIDNNYVYYFEKFQEIVSFVKQEIRKHLNKNSSSHTASYDEWFFTDDVTIYECNPDEIDEAYEDEDENLDVYGVRMYEKQRNVIFYYENTAKVIHVTYVPRFAAHKFIDLPNQESDDEDDDETESENDKDEDQSDDEEDETQNEQVVENNNEGKNVEERPRSESEKNIEKEEGEFTSIN